MNETAKDETEDDRTSVIKTEDGEYAVRIRDSYGAESYLHFDSAMECEKTFRDIRQSFEEAESE